MKFINPDGSSDRNNLVSGLNLCACIEEKLNQYIKDFCVLFEPAKIDRVFDEVTVCLDLSNEPTIVDNYDKMFDLINELIKKYDSRDNDNEGDEFLRILFDLSNEMKNRNKIGNVHGRLLDHPKYTDKEILEDLKKLEKASRSLKQGGYVNGLYNHGNRTIILFDKNIMRGPCGQTSDYTRTYCHEVMHAVIAYYLDEYGYPAGYDKKYAFEVVEEALARYFEIRATSHLLCNDDTRNEFLEPVLREVLDNSPIVYPYSGAQHFFDSYPVIFDEVIRYFPFGPAKMLLEHLHFYEFEIEIILQMERTKIEGLENVRIPSPNGGFILLKKPSSSRSNNRNNSNNGNTNISNNRNTRATFDDFKCYLVNQPRSFHIETPNEFLFDNKNSKIIDISKGDIIFHNYKGNIMGVSIATMDSYYDNVGLFGCDSGNYVRYKYIPLLSPVPNPFGTKLGYLHELDIDDARKGIRLIESKDDNVLISLISHLLG